MRKIIKILFIIFIAILYNANSQFMENASRSLFSDIKANKVGDAVVVLIIEETQADNTATTSNGRSTTLSGQASGQVGNTTTSTGGSAQGSLGAGTNFKGNGTTTRKETIKSKLSARVMQVDSNGNLRIQATRKTKVNGENQLITLEGWVRPIDISSDNTVPSYNIMDLNLIIEGDGSISKIQEPGLITKFLRILF
ncbi:MAG TPA: flagellar basal body L-ring protein FlgH [Bacteroidota bacterium]|nr:flagellar basal body L-ring protein FlgH [Candidatus Kapabacteria bacterium]HRS01060.1 flagellar basal body L-ring protein FlgH [Bacteroidota bacterium]